MKKILIISITILILLVNAISVVADNSKVTLSGSYFSEPNSIMRTEKVMLLYMESLLISLKAGCAKIGNEGKIVFMEKKGSGNIVVFPSGKVNFSDTSNFGIEVIFEYNKESQVVRVKMEFPSESVLKNFLRERVVVY